MKMTMTDDDDGDDDDEKKYLLLLLLKLSIMIIIIIMIIMRSTDIAHASTIKVLYAKKKNQPSQNAFRQK